MLVQLKSQQVFSSFFCHESTTVIFSIFITGQIYSLSTQQCLTDGASSAYSTETAFGTFHSGKLLQIGLSISLGQNAMISEPKGVEGGR